MSPSELLAMRRCDREVFGELLDLEGRESVFYDLRYIERLSLQQIADRMGLAYSTISHVSADVRRRIAALDV